MEPTIQFSNSHKLLIYHFLSLSFFYAFVTLRLCTHIQFYTTAVTEDPKKDLPFSATQLDQDTLLFIPQRLWREDYKQQRP